MTAIKVEETNSISEMEGFDRLTITSRSRAHQTSQCLCMSLSPKLKSMIFEAKKIKTPRTILEIAFPRSDDELIGLAVDFLNHGSYTCPVWGPGTHETTGIPFYTYSPMMFHHWMHGVSRPNYMDIPLLEKWTEERFLEEMGSVPTWDDVSFCVCTGMIWEDPDSCAVLRSHCVVGAHQHLAELLESGDFRALMHREWWGEFSLQLLLMISKAKVVAPVQTPWWEFVNLKREDFDS